MFFFVTSKSRKTSLKRVFIEVRASCKKTLISTNFFPSSGAGFRIFSGSKKKIFFFLKKKTSLKKNKLLRGGTVKSGLTIYPRLCSGPRSLIISSLICRLLGFQNRVARGCSPQFFKKGNLHQNYQKIVKKLKCKGCANDFLAMLDPSYKGQSTGNHLYFPMVPFFFR